MHIEERLSLHRYFEKRNREIDRLTPAQLQARADAQYRAEAPERERQRRLSKYISDYTGDDGGRDGY
jgi:hypothetical protein